MEIQYKIEKPSYFRLRLVWGMETEHKRVAKFPDCSWLPCKGDVMILPLDENPPYRNWHQYKVNNVIYDFEHQFVRVVCAALTPQKSKIASEPAIQATSQKFAEIERKFEARLAKAEEAISLYSHEDCDELDEIVDDELNQLKKRLDAL